MKKLLIALTVPVALSAKSLDLQEHLVNKNLSQVLDQHADQLYRYLKDIDQTHLQRHGVWQFDWLPGYYVKYGLARIKGMHTMKKAIKKYNLTRFAVPDKMVYHLKGRPTVHSNRNYAVIIKAVPAPKKRIPLTTDDLKDMLTLSKATGYISLTRNNYIKQKDGTIYLIDTESTFDATRPLKGFRRILGSHHLNTDLTPEALKYVLKKLVQTIFTTSSDPYEDAQSFLPSFVQKKNMPHAWDYVGYYKQLLRNHD